MDAEVWCSVFTREVLTSFGSRTVSVSLFCIFLILGVSVRGSPLVVND